MFAVRSLPPDPPGDSRNARRFAQRLQTPPYTTTPRAIIDNYLKRSRINITPAHEADHVTMGISLIMSTRGLGLLPAYAQNFLPASVTRRPLKGDVPTCRSGPRLQKVQPVPNPETFAFKSRRVGRSGVEEDPIKTNVIPSEMQSQPRGPTRAFGLSSHSDLELLIGQPWDSRRAYPFSEQLAQSMKRLSATMIPTERVLPLLCAPNGWSLIDTRDTCAVCESQRRPWISICAFRGGCYWSTNVSCFRGPWPASDRHRSVF